MRVDFVTLYIATYLWFAWIWPSHTHLAFRPATGWWNRTVYWLGLSHGWSMFANPITKCSVAIEARMFREDGDVEIRHLPRLDRLGIGQAFLAARHRIYQVILRDTRGVAAQIARPALVEYLWREYDSPENPLVRIELLAESQYAFQDHERGGVESPKRTHLIHVCRSNPTLP